MYRKVSGIIILLLAMKSTVKLQFMMASDIYISTKFLIFTVYT